MTSLKRQQSRAKFCAATGWWKRRHGGLCLQHPDMSRCCRQIRDWSRHQRHVLDESVRWSLTLTDNTGRIQTKTQIRNKTQYYTTQNYLKYKNNENAHLTPSERREYYDIVTTTGTEIKIPSRTYRAAQTDTIRKDHGHGATVFHGVPVYHPVNAGAKLYSPVKDTRVWTTCPVILDGAEAGIKLPIWRWNGLTSLRHIAISTSVIVINQCIRSNKTWHWFLHSRRPDDSRRMHRVGAAVSHDTDLPAITTHLKIFYFALYKCTRYYYYYYYY